MSESNPIVRFRARPTRGNAIKAFCSQCMGCTDTDIEPGFRRLVRECSSKQCALWQYRPFQHRDGDDDDMDAGPTFIQCSGSSDALSVEHNDRRYAVIDVWPPEGWQSMGEAEGVRYWFKGDECLTETELRARA